MVPPPPLDAEKVAVTERAWDIVTLHAAVPVQAPVQPLNWKPVPGWAVNDTVVVEAKLDVHVPLVQLMPAGLLVTVPVPVTATDSANCEAGGLLGLPVVEATKLAETDFAESIETLHAEVPLQAPDHPAKLKPDEGVAVSVTLLPALNEAEQLAPQLMPEGELATTPPAEDVTAREYVAGVGVGAGLDESEGAAEELVGALAGSRHAVSDVAISDATRTLITLLPSNILGSDAE